MRFIVSIIFVLVISLSVLTAEVDIGFFGGMTNFSFSGKAPENGEYAGLSGYGGALLFDVYFIEDLALSLQPGYMQKGARIVFYNRFEDDLIDSVFFVHQGCLNLPLNFKFYTPSHHFYFLGGFNLDYFLENTFNKEGEVSKDLDDLLRKYDLSINFGIAYQYFIKSFNFFLEFRYTQGFRNMNKSNYSTKSDDTSVYISNFKSGGILLLLGLSFRIY
jgi:hypothetical protein